MQEYDWRFAQHEATFHLCMHCGHRGLYSPSVLLDHKIACFTEMSAYQALPAMASCALRQQASPRPGPLDPPFRESSHLLQEKVPTWGPWALVSTFEARICSSCTTDPLVGECRVHPCARAASRTSSRADEGNNGNNMLGFKATKRGTGWVRAHEQLPFRTISCSKEGAWSENTRLVRLISSPATI